MRRLLQRTEGWLEAGMVRRRLDEPASLNARTVLQEGVRNRQAGNHGGWLIADFHREPLVSHVRIAWIDRTVERTAPFPRRQGICAVLFHGRRLATKVSPPRQSSVGASVGPSAWCEIGRKNIYVNPEWF